MRPEYLIFEFEFMTNPVGRIPGKTKILRNWRRIEHDEHNMPTAPPPFSGARLVEKNVALSSQFGTVFGNLLLSFWWAVRY